MFSTCTSLFELGAICANRLWDWLENMWLVTQVLVFVLIDQVAVSFFPKAWRRVLPLGSLELFS